MRHEIHSRFSPSVCLRYIPTSRITRKLYIWLFGTIEKRKQRGITNVSIDVAATFSYPVSYPFSSLRVILIINSWIGWNGNRLSITNVFRCVSSANKASIACNWSNVLQELTIPSRLSLLTLLDCYLYTILKFGARMLWSKRKEEGKDSWASFGNGPEWKLVRPG